MEKTSQTICRIKLLNSIKPIEIYQNAGLMGFEPTTYLPV